MDLRPDIRAIEDWLAQQLVVAFATDSGGATTPLEKMGDGWQSLIRVAALDVLSQYPDQIRERVVLLFEEPETYLHPHLVRKLRSVLEQLAGNGWTVVTATHVAAFFTNLIAAAVRLALNSLRRVSAVSSETGLRSI